MAWNRLTADDLRSGFKKIDEWLAGTRIPTIKQLEDFAKRTNTIVPYFFMESVPSVQLQIADFRTVDDGATQNLPSPELFTTIDEMLYRQSWLSDYFRAEGYEPLAYIGRYSSEREFPSAKEVAAIIRELLDLEVMWASDTQSEDEAWRQLRCAVEGARISIAVRGYPGNFTQRPFQISEFRGFCLSDEYAPIILLNGRDSKPAQMFTIIHEITHLFFAQSGVSDLVEEGYSLNPEENTIEKFCNAVAAEFLVPAKEFRALFAQYQDVRTALDRAHRTFRASKLVCMRRSQELGLITEEDFLVLYDEYRKRTYVKNRQKGTGGDFYNTRGAVIGEVMSQAVLRAVKSERLLYSDAFKLTGLSAKNFDTYYKRRGVAV